MRVHAAEAGGGRRAGGLWARCRRCRRAAFDHLAVLDDQRGDHPKRVAHLPLSRGRAAQIARVPDGMCAYKRAEEVVVQIP